MAAPAFAVARAGEGAVDDGVPGAGGLAGREGVDFGGRGGQAGEVERDAAQERVAIGGFGGRAEEGVDGMAGAGGNGGPAHGFERPVCFVFEGASEGRAGANPRGEGGQVGFREFGAAEGHARLFAERGELMERAGFGIAGDEGRAAGAAAQRGGARGEVEPALLRFGVVAAGAAGLQDFDRILRGGRDGQQDENGAPHDPHFNLNRGRTAAAAERGAGRRQAVGGARVFAREEPGDVRGEDLFGGGYSPALDFGAANGGAWCSWPGLRRFDLGSSWVLLGFYWVHLGTEFERTKFVTPYF